MNRGLDEVYNILPIGLCTRINKATAGLHMRHAEIILKLHTYSSRKYTVLKTTLASV